MTSDKLTTQDLVCIGRIGRPYGLRGECKVWPLTDFPWRFRKTKRVIVGEIGQEQQIFLIERVRLSSADYILLKFAGIGSREEIKKWQGSYLYIKKEEVIPLPEDSYYYFDLIGSKVITEQGEMLGYLDDIWALTSNDIFIVRQGEKEILLPAIKEVIKEVDTEKKVIKIKLIKGLLEE